MLQGLEAASAFIRRELGKVLRIRRMPELRFLYDTTLDSAMRIEAVLKDVLPDEGGVEDAATTDRVEGDRPGGRDGDED
jgi:ribosome-binding factor A